MQLSFLGAAIIAVCEGELKLPAKTPAAHTTVGL
jgi:hypothetical protein